VQGVSGTDVAVHEMGSPEERPPRRPAGMRALRWDLLIYGAIAAVTTAHYLTNPHAHQLHDIYRRLYYLPIILAAFHRGLRGGLVAATVVSAAYAPHAFGHISHDPASTTQKVLEMFLYFAVGAVTGALVSRWQAARRQLEGTAQELRQSLEQLRSTEEQLVQTAKLAAVGRLSAGLAHEIRNPLASIRGSAEVLAEDFPGQHPKRRLLEVLVGETARLNDVLSRFLAFARPLPLERQEFEVLPEIDAVITLLQGQREGQQVRILRGRTPEGPLRLRADREQLRQVLLNVLLNGCQAAGEGGEVRVDCEAAGPTCRISVHDTGPGFTSEGLANAFTPFFTTKAQGTGLGLAISHRIIESHGGRIRARNAEEGGGVVEIELPLGGAGE
jgi:two-component system sensor histidine kinase HydH